MGLFSSKKKTYVASTAYNMAGEFALRPKYLKTTMFRGIMMDAPSLGNHLVDAQFSGPNIDQRQFFRWARNYYPEGAVSGQISNYQNLDAADVAAASSVIPVPAGEQLQVVSAFIDSAEIFHWAERHILENDPELLGTAWLSDFDDVTGELNILYEDMSEEVVAVTDFNPNGTFLYVYYNTITSPETSPYATDSTTSDEAVRPNDTDFVQDSITSTVVTETLQDGDTETTRDEDVTDYEEVMLKDVYLGSQGDAIVTEHHRLTIWKRHRVIETATDYEEIEVYFDSHLEISTTTSYDTSNRQLFIYQIGSGNVVLDNLKIDAATLQEFFPIIPLRRHNKGIDHEKYADDYPQFAKAYKKSIGGKISELLESIEDTDDIGDIDHCFLVFGPEINTEHREGKRYIYEFFKGLIPYQSTTPAEVETWANSEAYVDHLQELNEWTEAQDDALNPLFNTPRPTHVSSVMPNVTDFKVKSTYSDVKIPYDTSLEWMSIGETVAEGLGKPGASKNDLWWEVMPDIRDPNFYANFSEEEAQYIDFFGNAPRAINHVRLYWQINENNYSYLDVYGMKHLNRVYDGKAVEITAKEGIEDSYESGFIVPMHYPTMKRLPLVWLNELGVQNRMLVFNSYQVVKQRWWERGIFKVIFTVVVAVVSALIFPGSVGLLGSHLAVGTAAGLSGTAALVAGAVLNAIAAIALSQILSTVAVTLFGEKWGGAIAAIAGIIIGNMAMNFHATGSFSLHWGFLSRADVLLSLTDAVAQGAQGFASSEIAGLVEDMESLSEDYEKQMDEIADLFMELGYSGIVVDPLLWMEQENSGKSFESSDTFIQRTLLTGSDISELTLNMVNDFTELSLTLPEPIA